MSIIMPHKKYQPPKTVFKPQLIKNVKPCNAFFVEILEVGI